MNKRNKILITIYIIIVFFNISCQKLHKIGIALGVSQEILFTVNGHEIPADSYYDELDLKLESQALMEGLSKKEIEDMKKDRNFRKQFIETMKSEYLIYDAAEKKGYLEDPKVKDMLEMARRQAVMNAYLKEKIGDVVVDDSEVISFYNENKSKMQGRKLSEVHDYIKQELMNQKYQMRLQEAVSKLMQKASIKENENLVRKFVKNIKLSDKDKKDWLFKIDNFTLTAGEYEKELNLKIESQSMMGVDKEEIEKYLNNADIRTQLLRSIKTEYLIWLEAKSSGFVKQKRIQNIIKVAEKELIISYYMKKKIGNIEISEKEIEKVYDQNRNKFAQMDILQAEQMIKYQIMNKKYQTELQQVVSKMMEEAKIVENEEAIKKVLDNVKNPYKKK